MKKQLVIWLLLLTYSSFGQDPTFSQFNLSKVYLNPAFAGYTRDFNATSQSRLQWTNVVSRYALHSLAVNVGCPNNKIGFALRGFRSEEGEGFLVNNNVAGLISVNLPGRIGQGWRSMYGKKYIVSFGMQFGVGQRFLDWSRLTFTDQIGVYEGRLDIPTAAGPQNYSSNMVLDMSAGVRGRAEFGSKGSYVSGGFALWHFNRPVESFFNLETQIEPRYTGHFFTHFNTHKYKNNSNYLTIGAIVDYHQVLSTSIVSVSMDFWDFLYLGISFRRKYIYSISEDIDALIFQGMFTYKGFGIGYSYDATISNLHIENTYGTHEIGITYTFSNSAWCTGRGSTRPRAMDCFFLDSQRVNRGNIHYRE